MKNLLLVLLPALPATLLKGEESLDAGDFFLDTRELSPRTLRIAIGADDEPADALRSDTPDSRLMLLMGDLGLKLADGLGDWKYCCGGDGDMALGSSMTKMGETLFHGGTSCADWKFWGMSKSVAGSGWSILPNAAGAGWKRARRSVQLG